jgi:hypothetical protein
MATAWAEAAACLDHLFALRNKFDDVVREARMALQGARDGHAQITQGNGSGQIGQDG